MASSTSTPTSSISTGWINPNLIEQSGTAFASYSIPATPPPPPAGGGGGGGAGGGGGGGGGALK